MMGIGGVVKNEFQDEIIRYTMFCAWLSEDVNREVDLHYELYYVT
jgi:hypothetical protein